MAAAEYDVAVVGAGPGGYVAALRAAQLGLKVAVVEQDKVGGTCLNRGCVPTKVLLTAAHYVDSPAVAREFGVSLEGGECNLETLMRRKERVVSRLRKGIESLFRSRSVVLHTGQARLLDPHTVGIEGEESSTISARAIIVATGSEPIMLRGDSFSSQMLRDSDDLLTMTDLPKKAVILGAGAIGCEYAIYLRSLGVEVILVEMLPRILPMMDAKLSEVLAASLKKKGIEAYTGHRLTAVEDSSSGVRAILDDGTAIECDMVLVSIGRRPKSDGLGLEDLGIQLERGAIVVGDNMQTSVAGVYAVGDVTGKMMLAHLASAQGVAAAENCAGRNSAVDYHAVPSCVFTEPEIASVGLSEEEAREKLEDVRVGEVPFVINSRAVLSSPPGELRGVARIVADGETDRVLGVHIAGPHATDLIGEGVLAVRAGLSATDLATAIHPHPTFTEILMEAALDVSNEAIHLP